MRALRIADASIVPPPEAYVAIGDAEGQEVGRLTPGRLTLFAGKIPARPISPCLHPVSNGRRKWRWPSEWRVDADDGLPVLAREPLAETLIVDVRCLAPQYLEVEPAIGEREHRGSCPFDARREIDTDDPDVRTHARSMAPRQAVPVIQGDRT